MHAWEEERRRPRRAPWQARQLTPRMPGRARPCRRPHLSAMVSVSATIMTQPHTHATGPP